MSQFLNIGEKAKFEVKYPFDKIYDFNKYYVISSIRNIKEMIVSGEEVFETIYKKAGLTENDFLEDINNNQTIITLVSEEDEFIVIPNSYIVSANVTVGVEYQGTALIFNLGALPVEKSLASLINDIKQYIYDTVGIDPTAELMRTSDKFSIDLEKHKSYEAARKAGITNNKSFRQNYMESLNKIKKLNNIIKVLEEFIKNTNGIYPTFNRDEDNLVKSNFFTIEDYQTIPSMIFSARVRNKSFPL